MSLPNPPGPGGEDKDHIRIGRSHNEIRNKYNHEGGDGVDTERDEGLNTTNHISV